MSALMDKVETEATTEMRDVFRFASKAPGFVDQHLSAINEFNCDASFSLHHLLTSAAASGNPISNLICENEERHISAYICR